jgi:hypothetical protein
MNSGTLIGPVISTAGILFQGVFKNPMTYKAGQFAPKVWLFYSEIPQRASFVAGFLNNEINTVFD